MKTIKTEHYEYSTGNHSHDPARLTILFIHGATLSKGFWDTQIKDLGDVANVLAPNLPGHGGSSGPGKDSVKAYSESILHFIHEAGIPKNNMILCGMSMGGAIVQQLLVDHPGTFRAGILINTGARLKVLPMIFDAVKSDFNSFIQSGPDFSLSPKTNKEIFRNRIIEFSSTCSTETALGDFTACNTFDIMERVPDIECPVLIFSAEHDLSTPSKYGAWLASHITNATHVHVNDAGHFSPIEKAETINAEIRRFISGFEIL